MPRASLIRLSFQSGIGGKRIRFHRRGGTLSHMKRTIVAAFVILLSASALADDGQRYLVATKRPFRAGGLAAALREARQQVTPRDVVGFDTFDGFAAELTASEVAALRASTEVRWVEPVIAR